MLKTVFTVYALENKQNDQWDEVGRFYLLDKAKAFCESNSKIGITSRIDEDTWEITRNGRVLLGTVSDIFELQGQLK